MTNARAVYAIFTEDGLDQETYRVTDARREAKDLREMGCKVSVYLLQGTDIDMVLETMTTRVRDMKPLSNKYLEALQASANVTIKRTKD